jgi:hypothetical protein
VIQITDKGAAGSLMTAPGNVLYIRKRRDKNSRETACVFIERPSRKRRQTESVASQLGRGAAKRLDRDGLVRDAEFRESLLKIWSN